MAQDALANLPIVRQRKLLMIPSFIWKFSLMNGKNPCIHQLVWYLILEKKELLIIYLYVCKVHVTVFCRSENAWESANQANVLNPPVNLGLTGPHHYDFFFCKIALAAVYPNPTPSYEMFHIHVSWSFISTQSEETCLCHCGSLIWTCPFP